MSKSEIDPFLDAAQKRFISLLSPVERSVLSSTDDKYIKTKSILYVTRKYSYFGYEARVKISSEQIVVIQRLLIAKLNATSKYSPHQGKRECRRRQKQGL